MYIRYFTAVLLLLPASLIPMEEYKEHKRPNMIICTSGGGGGHRSVDEALSEYFDSQYTITKVYPFRDVLNSLDVTHMVSFGKYNAEDLYNKLLQKRHFKIINNFAQFGQKLIASKEKKITRLLTTEIIQYKPNIIVSIIPYINKHLQTTAQTLQVPFLVIPTDLDVTSFFSGLSADCLYKNTHLTMSFKESTMLDITKKTIGAINSITITGFPVKKAFTKKISKKQKKNVRKEFTIPKNKTVCMIMMGAVGSNATPIHVKNIFRNAPQPTHIAACIGRNTAIKHTLEKVDIPTQHSISIIEFTTKIPALMSIADFIVTKSGSVSVNEALARRLPMIIDGTETPLTWEKMTQDVFKENALALVLRKHTDLPSYLQKISKSKYRKEVKERMEKFDSLHFKSCIQKLVSNIIQKQ